MWDLSRNQSWEGRSPAVNHFAAHEEAISTTHQDNNHWQREQESTLGMEKVYKDCVLDANKMVILSLN